MKPRADFSCAKCGKVAGGSPVTHEDLPVDSIRCPYTGAKRGFTRLFNAVNINGGAGRILDKAVDPVLDRNYAKHSAIKDGSHRFERDATEAMEKAYAKATPQERPHVPKFGPQLVPAAHALGMVPAQSRVESRTLNYPALTERRVVPEWQNRK